MAWPGVVEVVSRSPDRTDPYAASTLQNTLPIKATGSRRGEGARRSSTSAGLYWLAPATMPAEHLGDDKAITMSDLKESPQDHEPVGKNKGPHDPAEINPKLASDIHYWSEELKVTGQ